jgi:hypothetical protein
MPPLRAELSSIFGQAHTAGLGLGLWLRCSLRVGGLSLELVVLLIVEDGGGHPFVKQVTIERLAVFNRDRIKGKVCHHETL